MPKRKHTRKPSRRRRADLYVDPNGDLVECVKGNGFDVLVHYADIPESDITVIDGMRVTTPIRTAIDLAGTMAPADFDDVLRQFLDLELFTVPEGLARTDEPDMRTHHGAQTLRQLLLNRLPH